MQGAEGGCTCAAVVAIRDENMREEASLFRVIRKDSTEMGSLREYFVNRRNLIFCTCSAWPQDTASIWPPSEERVKSKYSPRDLGQSNCRVK
jgi:hypothetical protein